jgi:hypothetical protein
MRVGFLDQFDFPSARPFLETLFALNRKFDLIELFEVDQPMHAVSPAETAMASVRCSYTRRTRSLVTPM